jgi:hypothetical protein
MNNFHKHNRLIRFTGIVAVIIFGFLSILGSGGGGDSEGDGGGITVGLLPLYDFNIRHGYDISGTESNGMTVSLSINSVPVTLRVDPNPVTGTFVCDPTTYICAPNTINTGTLINLFDETGTAVGDLSITIPVQLSMGSNGKPDSGTIQITQGSDNIKLEMASCSGVAGVNIYYNDALVSCYTWDVFEQLIDTSEDPVLIAAVFGYQVFDFLFQQVNFTTEVFGIIDDNASDLEQYNTIGETCDPFYTAGFVAPPEVSLDPGSRWLSWEDVNNDGNVGPGDSFHGYLEECWMSPDQLLNGYTDFTGYVENIDQTRGVITAIGFTSVSPPATGGVFLTDFSIGETDDPTTPGTFEITNVIGVQGGFSILFNEP